MIDFRFLLESYILCNPLGDFLREEIIFKCEKKTSLENYLIPTMYSMLIKVCFTIQWRFLNVVKKFNKKYSELYFKMLKLIENNAKKQVYCHFTKEIQ